MNNGPGQYDQGGATRVDGFFESTFKFTRAVDLEGMKLQAQAVSLRLRFPAKPVQNLRVWDSTTLPRGRVLSRNEFLE